MMIDRGMIEDRIVALKAARQQALDNCNAYNGAIQQCEWLLSELDKPNPIDNGHMRLAECLSGESL